jgi:hypothetical protein
VKCYLIGNERAIVLRRWSGEAGEEIVEVRRHGRGDGSEVGGWWAAARAPPPAIQRSGRRQRGGARGSPVPAACPPPGRGCQWRTTRPWLVSEAARHLRHSSVSSHRQSTDFFSYLQAERVGVQCAGYQIQNAWFTQKKKHPPT